MITIGFLPTVLIFIGFFILTIVYTIKNRKVKIESHFFINELLIALLFLIAGILFPFMYRFHSPNLSRESTNYLWLFTSIFLLVELSIWVIILTNNSRLSKKNPKIMAERDYSKFCENFSKNWKDDLRNELGRKLLHFLTCVIIFFFWTLGVILDDVGVLSQWGLDTYSFSYWLIITIGYGFVIMFQIGDLVRLNRFYMLPNWAITWYMNMKESEIKTFISSTALVLALIPFIFAPFPILAAVALITTAADAAACLVGKKYGKHSLKKNSKKTIEGFIAGGLSTFIIVMVISLIYHSWMPVSIEKIILMSSIATILFLLVDYFAKNISDNILNPVLTGAAMWIIFLL